MIDTVRNINIDLLIPFENHPFQERNGIEQTELLESIKTNGLIEQIIVHPFSASTYEIISSHRHKMKLETIKHQEKLMDKLSTSQGMLLQIMKAADRCRDIFV